MHPAERIYWLAMAAAAVVSGLSVAGAIFALAIWAAAMAVFTAAAVRTR